VGRHLPQVIARRPKQPYRAPDHQGFFGQGTPEYADERLSPAAVAAAGDFDPASVEKLVRKCRSGTPGTRDNMALVGILSTQLLDQPFFRAGSAVRPRLLSAPPLPGPNEVLSDAHRQCSPSTGSSVHQRQFLVRQAVGIDRRLRLPPGGGSDRLDGGP